jgi:hypothetical protein
MPEYETYGSKFRGFTVLILTITAMSLLLPCILGVIGSILRMDINDE